MDSIALGVIRFLLIWMIPWNAASGEDGSPYALPPDQFLKVTQHSTALPQEQRKETPPLVPFLESLKGVGAVSVRGSNGLVRLVTSGQPLSFEDTFLTGPDGAARIVFEEGSQVLITPNSHVKIRVQATSMGFTHVFNLILGEARVLVQPRVEHYLDANEEPKKFHKFYVQTPTAMLGVRGTDFIVSVNEHRTEVHTLTGVVDSGHDWNDLKSGKFQAIEVKQTSLIFLTKIEKSAPFELGLYLKDFHERNPKLEDLWKSAVRDTRYGVSRAKFKKLKEAQMKTLGIRPEVIRLNKNDGKLKKKGHTGN